MHYSRFNPGQDMERGAGWARALQSGGAFLLNVEISKNNDNLNFAGRTDCCPKDQCAPHLKNFAVLNFELRENFSSVASYQTDQKREAV